MAISSKLKSFFTSKWTIGIAAVIIIGGGGLIALSHRAPQYQFITVKRGPITETVSLTGNTTPMQNVSLSFGASGLISKTYSDLGEQVSTGQILAELDMSDLEAGLHQAEAAADQQQATLEGLQTGASPADIALYQQKYNDSTSALIIAMNNAYLQADSAILHDSDSVFTNGNSVNPTLNIPANSYSEERSIETERVTIGQKLVDWQNTLNGVSASSTSDDINSALSVSRDTISSLSNFLNELSTLTQNLTPASSGLTQTQIDTDRSNINTAAQMISTGASSQQDAYAAWTSAYQTLLSEQAPSKPDTVDAQAAAVEAAQANVESAKAKIQNAELIAPISGVVTQFDAKVGQLASPGTPLVSIMANSGYEVDAGLSETDIGKVSVGDSVSMTLDAFPNDTFTGSVFYIAPSETNTQGVISYLVKISFDKPDPRLKSGLTANIDIETKHDDNALILPEYAILQNDSGTFVETLLGNSTKTTTTTPVTLGIQDENGNVEVLSGVTEGEQVINIGLKTQ
jgi:HlyD family secretion protein